MRRTLIFEWLLLIYLPSMAQDNSQQQSSPLRGSGSAEWHQTTIAELSASTRVNNSNVYWITDPGKEGVFACSGFANKLTRANGGTVVVNAASQVFKRVYNGFIDARWFGVVADATAPKAGIRARGTDNTPALQRALDAAEDGEQIIIPAGRYLFSTPLDTIKGPKRVNLLILGDTYHNGADFIIITNGSAGMDQHTIRHEGIASGRINMSQHTKALHKTGKGPEWSSFTGVLVKIFNASQQHIELNKVEGFKSPVEIIGARGNGSQENNIWIRWSYKNANGPTLTSLDGLSYTDKNEFWVARVSGGLGLKIDGYAGKAANGEIFNGAARSNKFHLMIEQVDSIAECHGDITEPLFDITVEGGESTGVFGEVGFRMRSEAPNFVRSPKYTGQGVFSTKWVQHGMGIEGTVNVPVWNSSKGVYYGNFALIDQEGNMVFQRSSSFTKANRDAAPANFRFVNFGDAELDVAVTDPAYTVASRVRYVYYNNASGKITLPTPHNSVGRLITIFNDHPKSPLSVLNVFRGNITSIPAGGSVTYRSNGVDWRAVSTAIPGN